MQNAKAYSACIERAHHHLRSRGAWRQLVEVQAGVEGDEAHMGPLPAWQLIQATLYGLYYGGQDAGSHSSVGDVNEEDVGWRHGRPDLQA